MVKTYPRVFIQWNAGRWYLFRLDHHGVGPTAANCVGPFVFYRSALRAVETWRAMTPERRDQAMATFHRLWLDSLRRVSRSSFYSGHHAGGRGGMDVMVS